jgi:hypothetical protein
MDLDSFEHTKRPFLGLINKYVHQTQLPVLFKNLVVSA